MLTVSLHQIKIIHFVGLYPQETLLQNRFEVDVDIHLGGKGPYPFVDYVLINEVVQSAFKAGEQMLESIAERIHATLTERVTVAEKIKIVIRKYNPPMAGEVGYAQICLEQ